MQHGAPDARRAQGRAKGRAQLVGSKRQFIQFSARLTPSRIASVKQIEKPRAVRRLDEVQHLVNDDVLEQISWFLDQLCIDPDRACPMVARAPARFHPLQEVAGDCNPQPALPGRDQGWENAVKKRPVPGVQHSPAFFCTRPRTNDEFDPKVIENH